MKKKILRIKNIRKKRYWEKKILTEKDIEVWEKKIIRKKDIKRENFEKRKN